MRRRFDGRLFISKSLAYFLEFAAHGVTKGSGLAFVADTLGFALERTIAFGDGENDIELLDVAGFGVAVDEADPSLAPVTDWSVPPRRSSASRARSRHCSRAPSRRVQPPRQAARSRPRAPRRVALLAATTDNPPPSHHPGRVAHICAQLPQTVSQKRHATVPSLRSPTGTLRGPLCAAAFATRPCARPPRNRSLPSGLPAPLCDGHQPWRRPGRNTVLRIDS